MSVVRRCLAVCGLVCLSVSLSIHVCTHRGSRCAHLCICVYTRGSVLVCLSTCLCLQLCAHIAVCLSVRVCLCAPVCPSVCIFVCPCVHECMCMKTKPWCCWGRHCSVFLLCWAHLCLTWRRVLQCALSPPLSLTEEMLEVTSKNISQWYQSIDELPINFFAVCLCGDVSDSSCCVAATPSAGSGPDSHGCLSPFSCCDCCLMLLEDFIFPDFL